MPQGPQLHGVHNDDMTKPEQRWRPIGIMPAFKFAISNAAESSRAQAQNMRVALKQPGLINRIELARLRLVYQDTAVYADMCREQLSRWRDECTTQDQAVALDRLDEIVDQWIGDTRMVIDAVNMLLRKN